MQPMREHPANKGMMHAMRDLPVALKVLVVDDQSLMCEMMAAALEGDGGFVVDIALTSEQALELVEANGAYDVVLLDYHIPGMDYLDALQCLTKAKAGAVVMFSGVANWLMVERSIAAGARGFIPKTLPLKSLANILRLVADGEVYLPASFAKRGAESDSENLGLKPREKYVLGYLCEGLQNKEIGRQVGIDETIVKMDVKSICRKLGARNRTQAVIEAKKRGLY